MPVKINGSTSGSVTLAAPASGSDVTLTLPGTTGTVQTVPGAWTDWTPTWTNLTVGNATQTAVYSQVGKIVFFRIFLTLGSTSSVGTSPQFTLPVTASTTAYSSGLANIGTVNLRDTGTGSFQGNVAFNSSTSAVLFAHNVSGTRIVNSDVTSTVPFTWTSTDVIVCNGIYEAA